MSHVAFNFLRIFDRCYVFIVSVII